MMEYTIYPMDIALLPNYVKKLNATGVNTSNCELYWNEEVVVGKKTYYYIAAKPIMPYEGVIDAPVYTDLISILPDTVTCNDKTYTRCETSEGDGLHAIGYYVDASDTLHIEYESDMCLLAYNMIMWLIENDYQLKNN